jgi:hypothetical protein
LFEILPEITETCIILDPFTRRTDERFFNPDELDAAWN